MKEEKSLTAGRRDFLKKGVRTVLLAGFALSGFRLALRTGEKTANGRACPVDSPCRSCIEFPCCRKNGARYTRRKKIERRIQAPDRAEGGGSGG